MPGDLRGSELGNSIHDAVMPFRHQTRTAKMRRIAEKVTCQKGGADVMFLPDMFREVCAQAAHEETTLSLLWA